MQPSAQGNGSLAHGHTVFDVPETELTSISCIKGWITTQKRKTKSDSTNKHVVVTVIKTDSCPCEENTSHLAYSYGLKTRRKVLVMAGKVGHFEACCKTKKRKKVGTPNRDSGQF